MSEKSQFWEDLKSGHFVSMVKESTKGQSLANSLEAYNVLKPMFAEEDDVEKVYIIFMDARNKILAIENMFSGSITSASIYPREIVKRIIRLKASAFAMVHNHPSGEINPSAEDQSITLKVGIAAASIDVSFHDHIIIGEGYHSMADTGWLKNVSSRYSDLLKPEPSMKRAAMTKEEQKKYESTETLRKAVEQLRGRKFRLDCGHYVTFNHHLANNIIVINGSKLKIICSLCGY